MLGRDGLELVSGRVLRTSRFWTVLRDILMYYHSDSPPAVVCVKGPVALAVAVKGPSAVPVVVKAKNCSVPLVMVAVVG